MNLNRKLLLVVGLSSAIPIYSIGFDSAPNEPSLWIARGLEEESQLDPLAALESFRQAEALGAQEAFVLQKIAQQLSDAAFLETDPTETERMAREALKYAQRAAEMDPNSAVNRLSLAVIYGRLAGYGNTQTKVDYAQRVKDEAEAALELDQGYAWAYHVLGRWHVEMSEIGQAKRFLASLLFGGLSKPSLNTAIEMLEKAVELEPESIAHRVELGYAYAADGHEERAREQWQTALGFDSRFLYDPAAKIRAREALGLRSL